MPYFCGVCASEDYTSGGQTDDERTYVTCTNPFHGKEPRVWEPPSRKPSLRSSDGIGAAMTVWDKLLDCVLPGEDYVPYGTVEDRFLGMYPDDMTQLITRYGHRWRDPDHPSGRFSASVYLGGRLSELAKEGLLEQRWGVAEGPWSYNGTYQWWRRAR